MSLLPRYRSALSKACILVASLTLLAGCTLPFQKKEVSGLQITTDGITASVFLNGNKVGETPYSDQTLKPGSYAVRLEPDDHELVAYETSITLYPTTLAVMNWTFGKTAETSGGVVYELQPLKKKKDANFSLASIPDGAIVKVDDVSQGFTPVLMKSMTAGTHRFQVTLPSYKDEEDSINIAEGFQMDVTVKLAKQKATTVLEDDILNASNSADASNSAAVASSSASKKTTATPTPKVTLKASPTKTASSSASVNTGSAKSITIKETGTGWLRVREKPEANATELAKVDVGKSFPFFTTQDGWYQIEYIAGKKGWVSGNYVKVN